MDMLERGFCTASGRRFGFAVDSADGGRDGEAEGPLDPGISKRVVLFASFSRKISWFCDLSCEAAADEPLKFILWVTLPALANADEEDEVLKRST